MRNLYAKLERLTKAMEVWASAPMSPNRPAPMRCRCGRFFRKGMETWLAHFNKDHPRLTKVYRLKPHVDRVNFLLKMLRAAAPKGRRVS